MNFTFLTKKQIYGKKKIEVFKPLGAKAAITDFAIVRIEREGTVD